MHGYADERDDFSISFLKVFSDSLTESLRVNMRGASNWTGDASAHGRPDHAKIKRKLFSNVHAFPSLNTR
jgi:hypothetical protein